MSSFSDKIVNKCKALVIKKTLCEEVLTDLSPECVGGFFRKIYEVTKKIIIRYPGMVLTGKELKADAK